MTKSVTLLFLICLVLFAANNYSYGQIGFGITAGLSTPNNNINDIYNSSTLKSSDSTGNLIRKGVDAGYNFGMCIRLPLADNFIFRGGISWHRFPESQLKLDFDKASSLNRTLYVTQNIIPIAAGLNYYIVNSIVGVYLTGEVTYNYISASVDYKGLVPLTGVSASPSDSRVGFGVGGGFDLDLKILTSNLEIKYNLANLIGKADGEQSKNFISFNLGIFFGDSNPKKASKDKDD